MNESILDSVKFDCGGLPPDDTTFDSTIISLINQSFVRLAILGVKRATAFSIHGRSEVWSDWITNEQIIALARPYISDNVRLEFDPPSSSSAIQILQNSIARNEESIRLLADLKGGAYIG